MTGTAEEVPGDVRLAGGQAHRFGTVGQRGRPELPVRRVPFTGAVGLVCGDQRREGRRRRSVGRARDEGGVGIGDPARDEGAAVTVDGDVVIGLVPDPAIVRELQQRVPEERGPLQVEGRGEVGGHPGLGGRPGIGFVREVDDGQVPGRGGVDEPADGGGFVHGGREPDPQRLGGRDHLLDGRPEADGIDRAVDLRVLAHVVGGPGGIEPLPEPHRALGGGDVQGMRGGHRVRAMRAGHRTASVAVARPVECRATSSATARGPSSRPGQGARSQGSAGMRSRSWA